MVSPSSSPTDRAQPGRIEPAAGLAFVRFHHGSRGRRGNYSEAELDSWAGILRGWSQHAEVYAYFNNDWEGFAPRNAEALQRLLG